jgi:putative transposase
MGNSEKYWHVTFHPYRRQEALLAAEVAESFYKLVRDVENRLGFSVLRMSAMPEHVHLLLELPPWLDLIEVIRQLKGYTARELLKRYPEMRLDMKSPGFWAEDYHYQKHSAASLNTVIKYIEDQKTKAGLEQ